jgi:pimeloyl-ACP methyl ester carboxylesterase
MSRFVLIPGAGGVAWYWHRVVPRLWDAGHEAVAVDLPGDDESAGLAEYARLVVSAVGDHRDTVLVAQSLGGFTAPLVGSQIPVQSIVLVNAMIPEPGETPSAWSGNTGSAAARTAAAEQCGYSVDFDLATYFLHDVPPEVAAAGEQHQRDEAATVFDSACEFEAWPDVPIRVVAGAADRLFPVDFQRQVARDRVAVEADVIRGGHLMALSNPSGLVGYLTAIAQAAG